MEEEWNHREDVFVNVCQLVCERQKLGCDKLKILYDNARHVTNIDGFGTRCCQANLIQAYLHVRTSQA